MSQSKSLCVELAVEVLRVRNVLWSHHMRPSMLFLMVSTTQVDPEHQVANGTVGMGITLLIFLVKRGECRTKYS